MDTKKPQESDGNGPGEGTGYLRAEEENPGGGGTDPATSISWGLTTGERGDHEGRSRTLPPGGPREATDIAEVARRPDGPAGSGHDRREPAWRWEGDGSRYRLEGHRPSLVIIVGWDRPLATYFVQVWDVSDGVEDHEEGELLLWGGTAWGELTELVELERALAPFAALPGGLAARLLAEQLTSPAGGR